MSTLKNENIRIGDGLSFNDKHHSSGLRGHVQIFRENRETGEKALWYEDDNVISISGMQWILCKMFGLHLDSPHNTQYEDIGRDTNLVMPDLNDNGTFKIGVNPTEYTTMEEDISSNHFIQGFMVGNGGSGEDAITTKNTDYSFIQLRNPIPFQQTQGSLDPTIAGKYLGNMRNGNNSFSKNYYIKKFESRPHIYHSWYSEGQSWDYVDPVSANDLGPNPANGNPRTNRIETYAQCELSIDTLNGDCKSYFEHEGSTQTALINELGLCAWDAEHGNRSVAEVMYQNQVKDIIKLIFDNKREEKDPQAIITVKALASDIIEIADGIDLSSYGQVNINGFLDLMTEIKDTAESTITTETWNTWQSRLACDDVATYGENIYVDAHYNRSGDFVYSEDKFLEYLAASEFSALTNDEAQRIRLITYYTFKPIPLDDAWKITVLYRIYAN